MTASGASDPAQAHGPLRGPAARGRHPRSSSSGWARSCRSVDPRFLSVDNLMNIATNYSDIGIGAVGMTLVLLIGGIDLSVASVMALGGLVAAIAMVWWGLPIPIAILLGVASGARHRPHQRAPHPARAAAALHRYPGHAGCGPGHRRGHDERPGGDRPADGVHRDRPGLHRPVPIPVIVMVAVAIVVGSVPCLPPVGHVHLLDRRQRDSGHPDRPAGGAGKDLRLRHVRAAGRAGRRARRVASRRLAARAIARL